MGKFILTGGTGFIGTKLVTLLLNEQHEVYILTRQKNKQASSHHSLHYVYWDPKSFYIDKKFILHNCKIINLAGASVASKRWTRARKREILQSRIESLQTLYTSISQKQILATHLLSASAIGFYGEGDNLFSEENEHGNDFLSDVCFQWEAAVTRFTELNIAVSIVRIGIVLGSNGGVLKALSSSLKFGIAAIPSLGAQIYSWIHIDDLCDILYFISLNKNIGIYNAVAPNACSVNEIFNELIRYTKPFFLKINIPYFLLKIILGEMSFEILKSTKVSSKKIIAEGFNFSHPNIKGCIESLIPPIQ